MRLIGVYETYETTCLTTKQAWVRFGVSPSTLYRWRKKGVIQPLPFLLFNRSKLYNYDDLIKIVESAKK